MLDPPDLPAVSASSAHASNLEFLRKQAKTILRAYHAGDALAIARISRACPHLKGKWHGVPRAQVRLADAQFTLARELGYASWPRLQSDLRDDHSAEPSHNTTREFPIMNTTYQNHLGLSAIDQIGMSCSDLEKAQQFYCDILGLRYGGEVPGMAKFFDCNGVNIIMFKSDKTSQASILYFKVEGVVGRVAQKVEQLRKLGVEITEDAQRISENWQGYDVYLAFFKDPFGNTLALKSDIPVK